MHIGIVRLQGSPEETTRLYEAWAPKSKRDKQNKMIFAERSDTLKIGTKQRLS